MSERADEAIEVLGCKAKRVGHYGEQYEARTPLGAVSLYRVTRPVYGTTWHATWWPRRQRLVSIVHLLEHAGSAADAAREATRRLRAIMRTCARAGAV